MLLAQDLKIYMQQNNPYKFSVTWFLCSITGESETLASQCSDEEEMEYMNIG